MTLAVLVSGWAHVLHAIYKPWGTGSNMYMLQHGSLFVTSFVFLMGLLFKVNGVSTTATVYTALAGLMLLLCVLFIVAWLGTVVVRMVQQAPPSWRRRLHLTWFGAEASGSSEAGTRVLFSTAGWQTTRTKSSGSQPGPDIDTTRCGSGSALALTARNTRDDDNAAEGTAGIPEARVVGEGSEVTFATVNPLRDGPVNGFAATTAMSKLPGHSERVPTK